MIMSLGMVAAVALTDGVELLRPGGVDLRPDAVVVQGAFRRRTVAWRDVRDVRLSRSRTVVLLERADGRRFRLGYPGLGLVSLDRRRFEADHRRVREWWLAHRDG